MIRQFFEKNRLQIKNLTVLTAYSAMQRTNDSSFGFEQEANFWWTCGINHPGWQIIIDGATRETWLVSPDVDESHQIFDGSLSWDDARKISGIDAIITQRQAHELLLKLSKKYTTVYTIGKDPYSKQYDFYQNPAGEKQRRLLKKYFANVKDCRLDMAKFRAIKQPQEIDALKKAISLTTRTFSDVKMLLPQLAAEYEVEAEFTYRFRKNNSVHAYDPIVAGGNHACTLHYNDNSDKLAKKSLLLIDIGARVDGYAADITRTYAVGAPTKRQIAVHAAVESAQAEIIAMIKPGLSVEVYQNEVDRIMQDALMSLSLLQSRDDTKTYRKYFPHSIGHGLGLDVHDSLGRPTELRPGMVLTVEPGIYIPEENIGVRIEDDILITKSGHKNLSEGLSTSL